jgi:hypothetical protein
MDFEDEVIAGLESSDEMADDADLGDAKKSIDPICIP